MQIRNPVKSILGNFVFKDSQIFAIKRELGTPMEPWIAVTVTVTLEMKMTYLTLTGPNCLRYPKENLMNFMHPFLTHNTSYKKKYLTWVSKNYCHVGSVERFFFRKEKKYLCTWCPKSGIRKV